MEMAVDGLEYTGLVAVVRGLLLRLRPHRRAPCSPDVVAEHIGHGGRGMRGADRSSAAHRCTHPEGAAVLWGLPDRGGGGNSLRSLSRPAHVLTSRRALASMAGTRPRNRTVAVSRCAR